MRKAPFKTALIFALVALIWGSTWIVIKDQLDIVPPGWSIAYRFGIAGLLLFLIARRLKISVRMNRKEHALACLSGVSLFCCSFNCVYAAEAHVTSGVVASVFALLMIPNAALSWLFLRRGVDPRFALGSAIALGGIALISSEEVAARAGAGSNLALGLGAAIAGTLFASIANVAHASQTMRQRPVASVVAWGMLYGAAASGILAAWVNGPPVVEMRPGYWLGLAYLSIVASLLAFALHFSLVRSLGPATAAYCMLPVPVIAMALSSLFEGHSWSQGAILGGVVVLAGMTLSLTASSKSQGSVTI